MERVPHRAGFRWRRPWALASLVVASFVAPAAWQSPASASSTSIAPPRSIAADCTVDVSFALRRWFRSLPPDSTVVLAPGTCYLVDHSLVFEDAQGLSISGGTWRDDAVPPSDPTADSPPAVLWFVGGSGVSLRDMTIEGMNPGGYHPRAAFAGGIRSDGVAGLDISSVSIDKVYGDGIELNALRANGDIGGGIVGATKNASISNVTIDGAGRQGITLADVSRALITQVTLTNIGINTFDLEADQTNEGVRNLTIDGCTTGGENGGLFFANGGGGAGGSWTGNITVEHCTMEQREAGDAVLVQTPSTLGTRGPFAFVDDTLRCGASVYVACLQIQGGDVQIQNSSLVFPWGTVQEPIYHVTGGSSLVLSGDRVSGYGKVGWADVSSTVNVLGSSLTPYSGLIGTKGALDPPPPSSTGQQPAGGSKTGAADAGGADAGAARSRADNEPAPRPADLVAVRKPDLGRRDVVWLTAMLAAAAIACATALGMKRRKGRPSATASQHSVNDPFLVLLRQC